MRRNPLTPYSLEPHRKGRNRIPLVAVIFDPAGVKLFDEYWLNVLRVPFPGAPQPLSCGVARSDDLEKAVPRNQATSKVQSQSAHAKDTVVELLGQIHRFISYLALTERETAAIEVSTSAENSPMHVLSLSILEGFDLSSPLHTCTQNPPEHQFLGTGIDGRAAEDRSQPDS